MTRAEYPPCGKVGCATTSKHIHTGRLERDERIVVTPKLGTAPGWAYEQPHGRYISWDGLWAVVVLDDGTTRRTSVDNLIRERLFKPAPLERKIPKPLHRPAPPLVEGWEEIPLFGPGAA